MTAHALKSVQERGELFSHVGDEVSEEDLEDASHLLEDDLEKEEELLIAQQEKKPASRRRRRTEEVK